MAPQAFRDTWCGKTCGKTCIKMFVDLCAPVHIVLKTDACRHVHMHAELNVPLSRMQIDELPAYGHVCSMEVDMRIETVWWHLHILHSPHWCGWHGTVGNAAAKSLQCMQLLCCISAHQCLLPAAVLWPVVLLVKPVRHWHVSKSALQCCAGTATARSSKQ